MTTLAFNQLKQPTLSGNFIADDFLGWTFLKLLLICLPGKNISETSSDGNKKKKFSWESGESCAFKKCRETPILKPESKILHLNKEGTSLCHTWFLVAEVPAINLFEPIFSQYTLSLPPENMRKP